MRLINLLFALILLPVFLWPQSEFESELRDTQVKLSALQTEIEGLRKQLSRSKARETSVANQISLIDKEVALIARSRGLLEQESRLIQKRIHKTNSSLNQTRERYNKLKDMYAKRLVYSYKYGKIRSLELILTSGSLNQALIRYQYLKEIAEHDTRLIRSIKKKKVKIEEYKAQLDLTLALKNRNLRSKRKEEQNYLARKEEKARLLRKIKWDEKTYKKQIVRKLEEKERLIEIIMTLEKKRKAREEQGARQTEFAKVSFGDFKKYKGKLLWPVKGKVITKYGKQRDPGSKTYIMNTDIEIRSVLGTPVKCVFEGVIRMITYLPGYGNTVIIDHGNGYYTVYSHLDKIYVRENEPIKTAQVIATVGDSGSLAGAKLQFGIYGGNKTYNPQKWLR